MPLMKTSHPPTSEPAPSSTLRTCAQHNSQRPRAPEVEGVGMMRSTHEQANLRWRLTRPPPAVLWRSCHIHFTVQRLDSDAAAEQASVGWSWSRGAITGAQSRGKAVLGGHYTTREWSHASFRECANICETPSLSCASRVSIDLFTHRTLLRVRISFLSSQSLSSSTFSK